MAALPCRGFNCKYKVIRFQRKLRKLTEQEVAEFLQGDPAGAFAAPDGLERALRLPYRHVLAPSDIIRGEYEFGCGAHKVTNYDNRLAPVLLSFSNGDNHWIGRVRRCPSWPLQLHASGYQNFETLRGH